MKKIIRPTEVARGRPEDFIVILNIRKDEIEFIETIRKANALIRAKYREIIDRPEHGSKWGFLDFPTMSFSLFNPAHIVCKDLDAFDDDFENWNNPKFHFNTAGDLACEITSPYDDGEEYIYIYGVTFQDSSNVNIL